MTSMKIILNRVGIDHSSGKDVVQFLTRRKESTARMRFVLVPVQGQQAMTQQQHQVMMMRPVFARNGRFFLLSTRK